MICVSIARGRHRHVKAEHKHLVEQGAKLVEIRLDYLRRQINLKRLLHNRPCPVVITCRRAEDQGKWTGSEESRMMLLRAAIAEGVEYVDLEEDIADKIPRYGKTRRIVSLHNYRDTPDDLDAIHARLVNRDADIVKLATMANHSHDNIRMLQLVQNATVPTVGICMGEIGTPSRILAGKFGAPFTYATFHHERTLAPGQLSFRQMTQIYHYEDINPDTQVYGVVGDPIGQSLIPVVHNAAFSILDINAVCVPFRVPGESLGPFLREHNELGIRGLSIAAPHKETVLNYLSKVDKAAEKIRAVNTVVFHEDGQPYGYNTDYRAAMAGLVKGAGVKRRQALEGKRALVLGAGNIARAVVFGLHEAKADIIIAARTFEQARELAEYSESRAVEWARRKDVETDILINCTPVGMHPHVDETPFEGAQLRRGRIVFDTIYNPEQTMLIKQARDKGCRIVTGVDMFVRRAALQFKLFTDQSPPADVMRLALKRATGAARF